MSTSVDTVVRLSGAGLKRCMLLGFVVAGSWSALSRAEAFFHTRGFLAPGQHTGTRDGAR